MRSWGGRDGLISWTKGLFCFCRSNLTNDGGFLRFRCDERHDDNNNDPVGYIAN